MYCTWMVPYKLSPHAKSQENARYLLPAHYIIYKQGTLRILTDMAFFLGQRKVEVERRTKGQTKREKLFCKYGKFGNLHN